MIILNKPTNRIIMSHNIEPKLTKEEEKLMQVLLKNEADNVRLNKILDAKEDALNQGN